MRRRARGAGARPPRGEVVTPRAGADRAGAGLPARLAVIVGLLLLMVAAMVAVESRLFADGPAEDGLATAPPATPAPPIAAEADVFRTRPGDLAAPSDAPRRPAAHRRTLSMYRSLRAFPGAPPRVPHGLQAGEYRGTRCNACHERGGWVERFASYAPLTPHPELADCLQCHLPDDAMVGVAPPRPGTDDVCLQCHVAGGGAIPELPLAWEPAAWPRVGAGGASGTPPPIPHGLEMRGNCLACHAGPAAVEEVRTLHPERADCRQCHVTVGSEDVFSRPGAAGEGAW